MAILPILNITQFNPSEGKGDFYANIFSTHLRTYHASIHKPHKHDFYLVVLFTKGTGIHEIDFNTFSVNPGSLFILSPGQTHHWELSEDIEGYIFFHSRNFYQEVFSTKNGIDYPIFNPHISSPHFILNKKERTHYADQFKTIYEEYMQDKWLMYRQFALLIDLLYIDFSRKTLATLPPQFTTINKGAEWLSSLQKLIDLHYATIKNPATYAAHLNITVKYLNKVVKHTVGKTTSDLIHERLILEAKRLLTHGESTIKEIAFELGFEDASYFSRFFKKKTGLSPSAFLLG